MPDYWEGDIQETETNTQETLASATKELEEVRSHIENAKNEVNCLKLAVSSLKNDLEMEKITLTAMKRRENLSSISVSSLEAELNRVHTELELIMNKDEDSREEMVDLPRALQQAAEEADHAKLVAYLMRKESESKCLIKLEETNKMIKKKKIFQIAAMGKADRDGQ